LLSRQFEAHRESWEKDGSHRGMNWTPPSYRGSFFGQMHAGRRWLFHTPDWVKGDRWAPGTLLRFRIAEGAATVGLVVLLLAIFVSRIG
jgi:hypothetical protein